MSAPSVDSAVQHTNDDSVLSKRSVVMRRYMRDPFLRAFVAKPARRAPLINRGYWLRMHATTTIVHEMLQRTGVTQCLSLGAGFDTLALRTLSAGRPRAAPLRWFEADFPSVMHNKATLLRDILNQHAATSDATRRKTDLWDDLPNCEFDLRMVTANDKDEEQLQEFDCRIDDSGSVHGVGVDLREPEAAFAALVRRGLRLDVPTVVYAECCLQYMAEPHSTALLSTAVSRLQGGAVVLMYDQIGAHRDPFGARMASSLRTRGSPLLGCETGLNDVAALATRARTAGMTGVVSVDFHRVAETFLSPAERQRMQGLEEFDEHEEWAIKCSHYALTLGESTRPDGALFDHGEATRRCFRACEVPPMTPCRTDTDAEALAARLEPWPVGRRPAPGWGLGAASFTRADASGACATFVVTFGGFVTAPSGAKTQSRSAHIGVSVLFAERGEGRASTLEVKVSGQVPAARMQHGFARVNAGPLLLSSRTAERFVAWGGREGPAKPLNDAWCLTVADPSDGRVHCAWSAVSQQGDVPSPRFRHAFAACRNSVLVSGGVGGDGAVLCDSFIGRITSCVDGIVWQRVQGAKRVGAASAAAVGVAIEQKDYFIISGGMGVNATVSDEVMVICNGQVVAEAKLIAARFSHSLILHDNAPRDHGVEYTFANVGGVGTDSTLGLSCEFFSVLVGVDGDVTIRTMRQVAISVPPRAAGGSAALVRAVVVPTGVPGCFAAVGGGYTCFSFGSYLPEASLLRISTGPSADANTHAAVAEPNVEAVSALTSTFIAQASCPVPTVEGSDAQTWHDRGRGPVLFRRQVLGTCVERWQSAEYLSSRCGAVPVTVHVSTSTDLEFVDKNYTVRTVPFAHLVEHCFSQQQQHQQQQQQRDGGGDTWYFRSVGRKPSQTSGDPELLEKAFPGIAADFALPSHMAADVTPRLHQMVLRVNQQGMRLWPHYDVLDNVLCQVVGRKRVVLFAPSEYHKLYMYGSSSRVANVDATDTKRFPLALLATRYEAVLEPGDVLFIPNLWVHQVHAIDACVSVNAFFTRLDAHRYDPHDSYGNKDLPEQRAAVAEAVAAVRGILDRQVEDREFRYFALQQLLQELSTEMQPQA
jgi:tRNA wybutosine-synthesizing protein 4